MESPSIPFSPRANCLDEHSPNSLISRNRLNLLWNSVPAGTQTLSEGLKALDQSSTFLRDGEEVPCAPLQLTNNRLVPDPRGIGLNGSFEPVPAVCGQSL